MIRKRSFGIIRACFVAGGIASVLWAADVFPIFWSQATLERLSGPILDGAPFKKEELLSQLPAAERAERTRFCSPAAVRSAAILRLRLAEDAIAQGDREAIDPAMTALRASVQTALSCVPSDAFFWPVLMWAESTINGFRPEYTEYLRISYQLAPNEGWIATTRNRIALAVFDQLPSDVAEYVVSEFSRLVDSRFYDHAVNNLVGPGWKVREKLMAGLINVPEEHRQIFAWLVYRRGFDVSVPGVVPREPRPWH